MAERATASRVKSAKGYRSSVDIEHVDRSMVMGTVQGGAAYRVVLLCSREETGRRDVVEYACDCGDFRSNLELCKHVLAMALVADDERGVSPSAPVPDVTVRRNAGLLEDGSGGASEAVESENDREEDFEEDDDSDNEEADGAEADGRRQASRASDKPPPTVDSTVVDRSTAQLERMLDAQIGRIRAHARARARRSALRERLAPPDPVSRPDAAPWADRLDDLETALVMWRRPSKGDDTPKYTALRYVVELEAYPNARPTVRVEGEQRMKDGTSAPFRQASLLPQEIDLQEPADRRALRALAAAVSVTPWARDFDSQSRTADPPTPCSISLSGHHAEDLLPAVAATGRLYLSDRRGSVLRQPLAFDAGPPRRAALRLRKAQARDVYEAEVVLARAHQAAEHAPIPATNIEHWSPHGWFVASGTLGRVAHDGGHLVVRDVLAKTQPLRIPAADLDLFLTRFYGMKGGVDLLLPPELAFAEFSATPAKRVYLAPRGKDRFEDLRELNGEIWFDYDGSRVKADDLRDPVRDVPRRRLVRRDQTAERAALEEVRTLGEVLRPSKHFAVPRRNVVKIATKFAEAGWTVEAQGKPWRTSGALAVRVSSGVDWFDVRGDVAFDGVPVEMPRLLAALDRGERTLLLADGSFGAITDETAARIRRYAAFAERTADGALRFSRAQGALLDALLDAVPDADLDAAFRRFRSKLATFAAPTSAAAPKTFVGTLRSYQQDGLGWLKSLDALGVGGCLADDMGLGKTIQVLAHLDGRRRKGVSLVVAPRSLLFNWRSEAEKFAPKLRVFEHSSPLRPQTRDAFAAAVEKSDLVLTTYGLVRRDAPWMRDFAFDYVVLDEAQAVKNATSDAAKAVRLLRAERRLALTGTPIENRVSELWSLFDFLQPGMLGSSRAFEAATARGADAAALATLSRALRPYLLRRTKERVAPELPARTEQTMLVELDAEERELYDELREHYRASLRGALASRGLARAKIQVLTALLRLRQAACHPGLLDKKRAKAGSAKLDALIPSLQEVVAGGHKALVFSQFTSFLDLVEPRLNEAGIGFARLDGSTTDRQAKVAEFRDDPGRSVFLISLKAGGTGLNLVEADYVFLLDPWWNPAVEAQAIDRAHRIGQTKPVTAYRLVAKDTVEERVLELQRGKRALADAVVKSDEGVLAQLSAEDLELLFA